MASGADASNPKLRRRRRTVFAIGAGGFLLLAIAAVVMIRHADLRQASRLYRQVEGRLLVRTSTDGRFEAVRLDTDIRRSRGRLKLTCDSVDFHVLRTGQWHDVQWVQTHHDGGLVPSPGFRPWYRSEGTDGVGFEVGDFADYRGRAGFLQPEIKELVGIDFARVTLEWEILVLAPRPDSIRVRGVLHGSGVPLPFDVTLAATLPED